MSDNSIQLPAWIHDLAFQEGRHAAMRLYMRDPVTQADREEVFTQAGGSIRVALEAEACPEMEILEALDVMLSAFEARATELGGA